LFNLRKKCFALKYVQRLTYMPLAAHDVGYGGGGLRPELVALRRNTL